MILADVRKHGIHYMFGYKYDGDDQIYWSMNLYEKAVENAEFNANLKLITLDKGAGLRARKV